MFLTKVVRWFHPAAAEGVDFWRPLFRLSQVDSSNNQIYDEVILSSLSAIKKKDELNSMYFRHVQ